MPPLAANQQTGQTNNSSSSYYGGYDSSSNYSGATGSEAGSSQDLAARDAYIQKIVDAINDAAEHGNDFEREKLQAQLDDAKKGRDNAYKIAKLNNDTQRYGYDQQRQTEIDKLKEDQRQYDSTHALDLKKYGLEVAKAYTQYASTPDQVFALNDFKSALGNVGQGQAAQNVITSEAGTPHAKTWQDFAALSGYNADDSGSGSTSTSGGTSSTGTTYSTSGGGSDSGGSGYSTSDTSSGDSGTVTATDGRQTAINAVTKAMPASDGEGHDEQDYAALAAIKALYFARKPGTVAALGQQRQKTALAGLSRLGYDSAQVNEDYQRSLPGQSSVRAA